MSRLIMAAVLMAFSLMLVLFWLFQPVDPIDEDEVRFSANLCTRVTLYDAETGRAVTGIEDVTADSIPDRILVSAHDRRDPALPGGAIYGISLWSLTSGTDLEVRNLLDTTSREEPFRPHGLALNATGDRIAVVNRPANGTATIEIGDYDGGAWLVTRRLSGQRLCRANDLDFVDLGNDVEGLQITLDRASCSTSARDLMPGTDTGRIALWDGFELQILRDGLGFPNGIDGAFIAETRRNRILRPSGEPVRLPGGPDNLNREDRRHMIVAMHPSLRRLWLFMHDVIDAAPSRIARVNLLTSRVDILFDDVTGALFSGASSAVLINDMLIAGSAYDDGLLVCRGSDEG